MHCPHCGRVISNDSEFCTVCGKRIAPEPEEAKEIGKSVEEPGQSAEVEPTLPEAPVAKESTATKVSSIIIFICGIIGLIFSLIRFVGTVRSCAQPRERTQVVDTKTDSGGDDTTGGDASGDDSTTGGDDTSEIVTTSFVPSAGPLNELDAQGNIKARTLLFYNGGLISNFLKNSGYVQVSHEGGIVWTDRDEKCTLTTYRGEDGHVATKDEFERMQDNLGAGACTWVSLRVSGYRSVVDALEASELSIPECTIYSNRQAYGIAESLYGKFFLTASVEDDGMVCIQIFNKLAIEAGAMAEYGTTIEEVYEGFVNG